MKTNAYADTAGRSSHTAPPPLFATPTPAQADELRSAILGRVEDNANDKTPRFTERAAEFVTAYLRQHGDTPGEDIVTACKNAGIVPHDDRAFGAVFQKLSRRKVIYKAGYCPRRKGHGTSGGNIWGLAK